MQYKKVMELLFEGKNVKVSFLSLHGLELATLSSDCDSYEVAHVKSRGRFESQLQSAAALTLAHRLAGDHVRHDPEGRPRFLSSDMDLSLSHKDFAAVAAVVPAGLRVGVDLENHTSIQDPEKFARHVLSEDEHAHKLSFQKIWKATEAQVTATLWSLKESLFKASGRVLNPARITFSVSGKSLSEEVLVGEQRIRIVESYVHCTTSKIITALVLER